MHAHTYTLSVCTQPHGSLWPFQI
uniref:Uncharacterized protein n=1 Tax=Anguilla anguilla TaxID=7936 RepID=A0A0E9W1G3_ANGAN